MNSLCLNMLYYGQQSEPPERLPLRAGPLSLNFENGAIRYIRLGDREVLRNVYVS
jgi:D-apionolactonase